MSSTNQTNIVEDVVGGLFSFTGKLIGGTLGYTVDAAVGVAKGVTELPGAVADSFVDGYEFIPDNEPKEADAATPAKAVAKEEPKQSTVIDPKDAEIVALKAKIAELSNQSSFEE